MNKCTLTLAVLASAAPALAAPVPVTFTRISSNSPDNVEAQFLAIADEGPGGTVTFRFTNTAVIPSSITNIYFDDNDDLLSFSSFVTQTGTSFAQGGTPSNLPGGASISPPFVADTELNVSASGNPVNGINAAADVLVVGFNLLGGADFADVEAALTNGDLRIGLHVRAIGADGEESDSFVSLIPLPTSAALAAAGLGCLGLRRRR